MLSQICLSVVCDVRAPYTGGLTFRGYFHHIVAWPPKITNHEGRPRDHPLRANLPNRRVAVRLF